MSKSLPITVSASKDLLAEHPQLVKQLSPVEAWLNFRTLGANWFADENKIIRFHYRIVSSREIEQQSQDGNQWQVNKEGNVAILSQNSGENSGFNCVILIAVTDFELSSSEDIAELIKPRIVLVTNQRAKALGFENIAP